MRCLPFIRGFEESSHLPRTCCLEGLRIELFWLYQKDNIPGFYFSYFIYSKENRNVKTEMGI